MQTAARQPLQIVEHFSNGDEGHPAHWLALGVGYHGVRPILRPEWRKLDVECQIWSAVLVPE